MWTEDRGEEDASLQDEPNRGLRLVFRGRLLNDSAVMGCVGMCSCLVCRIGYVQAQDCLDVRVIIFSCMKTAELLGCHAMHTFMLSGNEQACVCIKMCCDCFVRKGC